MPQNDNPLFHLEPVAVAAFNKAAGRDIEAKPPSGELVNAMIQCSIGISLKRIADATDKLKPQTAADAFEEFLATGRQSGP